MVGMIKLACRIREPPPGEAIETSSGPPDQTSLIWSVEQDQTIVFENTVNLAEDALRMNEVLHDVPQRNHVKKPFGESDLGQLTGVDVPLTGSSGNRGGILGDIHAMDSPASFLGHVEENPDCAAHVQQFSCFPVAFKEPQSILESRNVLSGRTGSRGSRTAEEIAGPLLEVRRIIELSLLEGVRRGIGEDEAAFLALHHMDRTEAIARRVAGMSAQLAARSHPHIGHCRTALSFIMRR
jgi:hypothetical protein